MKEKFKKNSAKKKSIVARLIVLLCLVLLIIGAFLLFVGIKNIIEVSKEDDSAKLVSDDVAANSTPILVNNLLLGGVYNGTWVSSERFYFKGDIKKENKIDVYTSVGKKGTYELENMTKAVNESSIYITTSNTNKNDEYVAVTSSSKNIMPVPAAQFKNLSDEDYSYVKKALGIYRIYNPSIKITDAYDISIDNQVMGKIYVVTNEPGKFMGGYSAIIYRNYNGNTEIVKYSYVNNFKKSEEWPIYSFKFIADLNGDGKNEIVIQETKEFYTEYDIIEYRNGKFIEVLSSRMS